MASQAGAEDGTTYRTVLPAEWRPAEQPPARTRRSHLDARATGRDGRADGPHQRALRSAFKRPGVDVGNNGSEGVSPVDVRVAASERAIPRQSRRVLHVRRRHRRRRERRSARRRRPDDWRDSRHQIAAVARGRSRRDGGGDCDCDRIESRAFGAYVRCVPGYFERHCARSDGIRSWRGVTKTRGHSGRIFDRGERWCTYRPEFTGRDSVLARPWYRAPRHQTGKRALRGRQ